MGNLTKSYCVSKIIQNLKKQVRNADILALVMRIEHVSQLL